MKLALPKYGGVFEFIKTCNAVQLFSPHGLLPVDTKSAKPSWLMSLALRSEDARCEMACVSYIESMFDMLVSPEDIAAFIMEPIGGSGGYQVPPREYIPAVKKLCERHGINFISEAKWL